MPTITPFLWFDTEAEEAMQFYTSTFHNSKVIPSMWWSIELQATTPVREWDGQQVRMAQEEDALISADGKIRWARGRQDKLFLVR